MKYKKCCGRSGAGWSTASEQDVPNAASPVGKPVLSIAA
jgi:hypothetical protein